ncbi:ATP-grasp domain-containing protein [Flexivirga caeni]|uniref:ATP-grasp domain-containing protein n=1 Tax=Flexivirga caeni TaxID=2294115 RepID=UPI0015E8B080|nr:ATP-grasp domain-containing protein [Flexivirga caeni]
MTEGRVVVLTTDAPSAVSRADIPAPADVMQLPADQWATRIRSWATDGDVQVVTNDEYSLADLAEIRDALGLDRVTPALLDRYLDKVAMKQALQDAEIAVPTWHLLPTLSVELALPDDLGFPCVVKPRVGANSRGVRVLRSSDEWLSWLSRHSGETDWEVEEFVSGQMCFVDGLVTHGHYCPVLVGRYVGGLLPTPDTRIFGAVDVPPGQDLHDDAIALGARVARALGTDGRFATHLEFFETGERLVVMEVCARAPGAMVSEMARVVSGHNLESAHLQIQAGLPAPAFHTTGRHAAWISLLGRPRQNLQPPPTLSSALTLHRLPAKPGHFGRYVSAIGLLVNDDHRALSEDLAKCAGHCWF